MVYQKSKSCFVQLACLLGMVLLGHAVMAQEKSGIQISADPRVELMSIVFRLAGNQEYNMANSKCPYTEAVDEYFMIYKNHPLIQTARRLREKYGVSYDAPMSLAVHIDNVPSLALRVPLRPHPAKLDKRWQADEIKLFLGQARDFVEKSGFMAFHQQHKHTYLGFNRHLQAKIQGRNIISWFDGLFGAKPGLQTRLVLSAINGGSSYGATFMRPDASAEVYSIIGMHQYDQKGMPVFTDFVFALIVHEFAHSYVNPLVLGSQDLLKNSVSRLFQLYRDQMKASAYGTWQIMACETLVRAVVQLYLRDQNRPGDAARHLEKMKQRGFAWVGKLADLLERYRKQRPKQDDLKPFLPQLAAFFKVTVRDEEEQDKKRPVMVSMSPANGAGDVNPDTAQMQIVFDRPMRKGWALVGGGKHYPDTGDPSYDAARKILTVPVKLKPNWSYKFWLNSNKFQGFRSAEGVALRSVKVEFKTRGR